VGRRKKKHQEKTKEPSLKAEWQSWYASKRPVLWFTFKFGTLLALFYILFAMQFCDRNILYPYLEANAWLANAILNVFGQHTHLSDVTIQSPQFTMAIHKGCDAVEPTWLLCAAILSFPASWRHKILGMLTGIILLQALNLVRIITLYWIGVHLPSFFNSAHMEIWPTAFIIVAITLFVGWKQWSSHQPETHAA
jgi:exosortase H (IPTLxxWG-CTERM-specific)